MSAIGGKADIDFLGPNVPLVTRPNVTSALGQKRTFPSIRPMSAPVLGFQ